MNERVQMGEVKISSGPALESQLGTCVSACLYFPSQKIGGMTHISRCRESDTTPSGRLLRHNGFHYADAAIPRLIKMLKHRHEVIKLTELRLFVFGGWNNEGPLRESLEELGLQLTSEGKLRTRHDSKYRFKLSGYDINQFVNRNVVFDLSNGKISIYKQGVRIKGMSAGKKTGAETRMFHL